MARADTEADAAAGPAAAPLLLRDDPSSPSSPEHDSSAPMSSSANFTPGCDSDGDSDGPSYDGLRHADMGAYGLGLEGDEGDEEGEAYELQDRGAAARRYTGAIYGDEDEEGYGDGNEGYAGMSSSSGRAKRRRVSTSSTVASFMLYTPDEDRTVRRKFDRRLVVFLGFCYLLSFLDRSNIGSARIAGMESDLQTRPPRPDFFEWALRAFYLSYIAFEWMSLLWKIIPPHVYVALLVLSWGVCASLQAVATSYPVLIALRVLLGIGEAGFTGVPVYLARFYRRRELALRTAVFISAAPLATAFAGFLAWLILWLGKNGPIAPWRLLFLCEGFPSVVVATIAWGVIPDSPDTAYYLTARERRVARLRLRHEHEGELPTSNNEEKQSRSSSDRNASSGLKLRDVLAALLDPKAWITAVMFFLANMAYSTLPNFFPTILQDMGHSAVEAEALTAPPNLIAFGIVLLTARLSDRTQQRALFVAAHALVSAAGYAVLALARPLAVPPMLRYLAVYPAATGFFSVVVLVIAWSVNNQPSEGRQGGGFALLQVVGQCGPLLGTHLYPDRDAPFFERGMWACCGAMAGVAVLALALRGYLARLNRRLDNTRDGMGGAGAGVGDEAGNEEEARGLVGDEMSRSGGFRYML
ncbi:Uu.00g016590.m01.CDS01 [Anthostomella pinea]|uniref:Uu.00g016590.m01.CDS01 n=1 Tax=Anthostomella pinea TaxID=933095 RepID=A0AAI8VZB2_9PEZI|nr:Uu.00g016590.m01.CDS01 [Anthostomella pinea]